MPQLQARKLSDYIKPIEPFYPDATQVDLTSIMNTPIIITDSRLIPDMPSKFGEPRDAVLIAFNMPNSREIMTTITSHPVPVKKLKELSRKRAWPVICKFIKSPRKTVKEGEDPEYYDLGDA